LTVWADAKASFGARVRVTLRGVVLRTSMTLARASPDVQVGAHQFGVAVDAVRTGEQVDQVGTQTRFWKALTKLRPESEQFG